MRMRLLPFLLLAFTAQVGAQRGDLGQLSTDEVIARADRVIALAARNNMAALPDVEVVFEAASRLERADDLESAAEYYRTALQLSPWQLDRQLSYAGVLKRLGRTEESRETCEMVAKTAEDQALIQKATLLGRLPPGTQPTPPPDPLPQEVCIIFVPIGEVDTWLLAAASEDLQARLGSPVFTMPGLAAPAADRNTMDQFMSRVQTAIPWKEPAVRLRMVQLKIRTPATATPEQMVELLCWIVDQEKQVGVADQIRQEFENAKRFSEQHDANKLIQLVSDNVRPAPNTIIVGITGTDIYADGNNFLFGQALRGKPYSVVSFRRYSAAFTGEPPNPRRLRDRLHKQLLSSIGFSLGIDRPTTPNTARSYSNSLPEHDAKSMELSPACVRGFERALGHPLPQHAPTAPAK